MRPFRHDVVLGVVFAIASSVVAADDWSRFRGPNGDSIANQSKHPVEWSEDSNVAWKVKIPGRGWSQPIVTGDNSVRSGTTLRSLDVVFL